MAAQREEEAVYAGDVTMGTAKVTPGTLFAAMDTDRDSLLSTDEVMGFLSNLKFGVSGDRFQLKGALLTKAEVNATLISVVNTRAPADLIDFGELKSAMTDTLVTNSDGTKSVNNKLEAMAFATLGLPEQQCPSLIKPAAPPPPSAPPCSPPPPTQCGPFEEADGYNSKVGTAVTYSNVPTMDMCMMKCCEGVHLGYVGVQYDETRMLCEVTSKDPIWSEGFKAGEYDYGSKKSWQAATLLM